MDRLFRYGSSKLTIRIFVLCTILSIPPGTVAADSASKLTGDQILDLMFPYGTEWEQYPVVKWSRKPVGLIVIESDLTESERSAIRNAVDSFERNAPPEDITVVSDRSSEVVDQALKSDFTIVFGNHAMEEALGRYKPLLLSVLPDQASANAAVSSAIAQSQPAFAKYRFDVHSGNLNQFATFVDGNGNPEHVRSIAYMALFSSLSPSVISSKSMPLIVNRKPSGLTITALGFSYLTYLYESVPPGATRSMVETLLPKH